jgi:hypothetical protein
VLGIRQRVRHRNIAIQISEIDGYEWVFDSWTGTHHISSDFDVIPPCSTR